MAKSVTAQRIIDLARFRADMVNNPFVQEADAIKLLDEAYNELHERLVEANLGYFRASEEQTSFTGNTKPLPSDLYGLYRVERKGDDGDFYPIQRLAAHDVSRAERAGTLAGTGKTWGYDLEGSNIGYYPQPSANDTFRLIYATVAPSITAVTDTLDGVSGWEKALSLMLAIEFLGKEESDTTRLERQLAQQWERIERAVEDRDMASPYYITQVETRLGNFGGDDLW